MKRADAQKSIDEAFADGLKNLFMVLQRNLVTGQTVETSAKEFAAGIAKYDQAHSTASAVIENIFKD